VGDEQMGGTGIGLNIAKISVNIPTFKYDYPIRKYPTALKTPRYWMYSSVARK